MVFLMAFWSYKPAMGKVQLFCRSGLEANILRPSVLKILPSWLAISLSFAIKLFLCGHGKFHEITWEQWICLCWQVPFTFMTVSESPGLSLCAAAHSMTKSTLICHLKAHFTLIIKNISCKLPCSWAETYVLELNISLGCMTLFQGFIFWKIVLSSFTHKFDALLKTWGNHCERAPKGVKIFFVLNILELTFSPFELSTSFSRGNNCRWCYGT